MLVKLKTFFKLIIIVSLPICIFVFVFRNAITPLDGPLYTIKRAYEKAALALKLRPEEKAGYSSDLLDSRLYELLKVTDAGDSKRSISASLRYYTAAGELVDFVIAYKMDAQVVDLRKKLIGHKKILSTVMLEYLKENQKELNWLQDDINYLDLSLDKLSKYTSHR